MAEFDLPGTLRRIRRRADMSQRQLADAITVSQSAVAHAEDGRRDFPATVLAQAAGLAGLRLALLDSEGCEVSPMAGGTARDMGGRRLPAHLDTVHSDERAGRYEDRYYRSQPWYTVDRSRECRDVLRERFGTPDDHDVPEPGTEPWERRKRRRAEARRRRQEEWQRRLAAGEIRLEEPWTCHCPPGCEELDDRSGRPVHAQECGCQCDLA